jgi:hypothetical protein
VNHHHPDPPWQFLAQIGAAVEAEIHHHVREAHLPPVNQDQITALPFPGERLSDVELARMAEAMESEGLDVDEVAHRFGRPYSLVFRELASYYRRQEAWVRAQVRKRS